MHEDGGAAPEGTILGTTWSCRDLGLVEALDTLNAAGFREVEVWADGTHLDPRAAPDLKAARDWLDEHPLSIRSVHLPFDRVSPGVNAAERARTWVDLCARTLADAASLGAEVAVAHPVLFIDPGESRARGLARLVSAADAICAHARGLGVELVLENMHTMRGPTLRSVAELQAALDTMTCSAGICLDIGHAVFNGYVGEGLTDEIVAAGELLSHSHIHDSDGVGRDPHMVPGDGIVDWPSTMAAYRSIGFDGLHVLEVDAGGAPRSTLARARRNVILAMR